MKAHNLFSFLLGTSGLFLLWTAVFPLAGCGVQESQDPIVSPDVIAQSNHSYFTSNSETSQENSENSSVNTVISLAEAASSERNTAKRSDDSETIYTIRTYKGKIGVFRGGSESPSQTVDVPVSTLPQSDRKALSAGITVTGKDALRRALEDYES